MGVANVMAVQVSDRGASSAVFTRRYPTRAAFPETR